MSPKVEEFFNSCHDKNGRFCGSVAGGGKRFKSKDRKKYSAKDLSDSDLNKSVRSLRATSAHRSLTVRESRRMTPMVREIARRKATG